MKHNTTECKHVSCSHSDYSGSSFLTHLIKHVPAPNGSQHRAVAPSQASQHTLLAAPLLFCVRDLRRTGQRPRPLLLQRLGAVDAQRAELILSLGEPPAGDDGGLHAALLALAQGHHGAVTGARQWR